MRRQADITALDNALSGAAYQRLAQEPRWKRKQREAEEALLRQRQHEQQQSAMAMTPPAHRAPVPATPGAMHDGAVASPGALPPDTGATGDRFVPQARTAAQLEYAHETLLAGAGVPGTAAAAAAAEARTEAERAAQQRFRAALDAETSADGTAPRILTFTAPAPAPTGVTLQDKLRVVYAGGAQVPQSREQLAWAAAEEQRRAQEEQRRRARYVGQTPERVLDAPELVDDYYLNLLDWSPTDNVVAVALGRSVFLWAADTGGIAELLTLPGEDALVTAVRFMRGPGAGPFVVVGTGDGDVQLWDCARARQLRSLRGCHAGRVGAAAWSGFMLAAGAQDATITLHDVRQAAHHVATLAGHEQEVCGLEWAPAAAPGSSGLPQLASGANDNVLNVWDPAAFAVAPGTALPVRGIAPRLTLTQHCAAVKALAWCPWQHNLLASGGGTADRTLRLWNTDTGVCLASADTRSQVTSVQWSLTHRELVTSHGFSMNQLSLWKYPRLEKIADITGHEKRILHTARSPDGTMVVSAGADETLRFWSLWPRDPAATTTTFSYSALSGAKCGADSFADALAAAKASCGFSQMR